MSQRMRYFILLMLINLVVVVIYMIFEHLRRKEKWFNKEELHLF